MRRALALLALGLLLTMAQGVAATVLPARWCPDLGLLLAVAIGLCWRSAVGGIVVASAIGYVADLLSGTLLGQHALLRVLAFGVARAGSGHLNLRGALPQAAFVALLTLGNAAALAATTAFFIPTAGLVLAAPGALAAHAFANAVCAPLVTGLTARLVALLGSEEGGRRMLRLEPRSFGT